MSATHPPIPPNCPRFFPPSKTDAGLSISTRFDSRFGWYVYLEPCDVATLWNSPWDIWPKLLKDHRDVIAAVARCAWLDEADRHWPTSLDEKSSVTMYGSEPRPAHTDRKYREAMENAKAWAEWGKSA